MRHRGHAPLAMLALLAITAACGHPEKSVVDSYFNAVNAHDNQTLSSFAVVSFDKPVQRGALVLPRLHVLDVDQGSDRVRPDVAVTVRDHLQDDAVVVLVEPAPTVERQVVRVDELSRGECLLHPRDQRIAGQRCRPQGKSQEAGIQCRDEHDGPMNAGGADAPAAGAFV